MAGIYNGPARGGTRGGKDQFQWEDVKEDKQGQNYLGHSVKAAHGRWQKNKDLNWAWSKSKLDLKAANKSELQMAKAREADLMAQMLGEKPMQRPESELDRREKNKLFKKGDAEEGTVAEGIAGESFGERIEGLGFAPVKVDNLREMLETKTHERQEGKNDLLKAHAGRDGDGNETSGGFEGEEDGVDYAALLAGLEGGNEDDGGVPAKLDKKSKKDLKKAAKDEKKRLKAEKKESKKEKKDKKDKKKSANSTADEGRRRRHDVNSSNSSDSESADVSKARKVELAARHREWARGGSEGGEGSQRSPPRQQRTRSSSRDRRASPSTRSRSRDRSRRDRGDDRDRERERSRGNYRENGRDRDRSRDRR